MWQVRTARAVWSRQPPLSPSEIGSVALPGAGGRVEMHLMEMHKLLQACAHFIRCCTCAKASDTPCQHPWFPITIRNKRKENLCCFHTQWLPSFFQTLNFIPPPLTFQLLKQPRQSHGCALPRRNGCKPLSNCISFLLFGFQLPAIQGKTGPFR